jgi:hypothetical protein
MPLELHTARFAFTMQVYEVTAQYHLVRLGYEEPLESPEQIVRYIEGAFDTEPTVEAIWVIALNTKSRGALRSRAGSSLGTEFDAGHEELPAGAERPRRIVVNEESCGRGRFRAAASRDARTSTHPAPVGRRMGDRASRSRDGMAGKIPAASRLRLRRGCGRDDTAQHGSEFFPGDRLGGYNPQ